MRPVPASPEQERGLWVDLARAGPFVAGRHRMAVPQVVMDPNTGKQRLGMIVRAAQASQLHPGAGAGRGRVPAPLHFGKFLQKDKFLDRYFNQLNGTFWG